MYRLLDSSNLSKGKCITPVADVGPFSGTCFLTDDLNHHEVLLLQLIYKNIALCFQQGEGG